MTRWGTATLLIETGGWNGPDEAGTLVRLNFVALLGSLQALADGSLAARRPEGLRRDPGPPARRSLRRRPPGARVAERRGASRRISPTSRSTGRSSSAVSARASAPASSTSAISTDFRGKEEIDAAGQLLVPAPPGGRRGMGEDGRGPEGPRPCRRRRPDPAPGRSTSRRR